MAGAAVLAVYDLDHVDVVTTGFEGKSATTSDDKKALHELAALLAVDGGVSMETLAKLGALGYLGGGATEAPAGPRPNPRDELPSVAPILRGMRLYPEGSLEAAVATLRPAVEARPEALLGWRYLGRALAALGRRDEAREALAHALRGSERESFLTTSAALRMIDLGRPEAALEMLRQALARGGDSADLRLVESRALLVLGRLAEARAAGEAAVAADPALADARYQLAVVELTAGDAERGATELEAALAREPRHLPALKALAVVRYRLGSPEAARALLERAADIAPEDPDVRDGLERLRRDDAASGAPR